MKNFSDNRSLFQIFTVFILSIGLILIILEAQQPQKIRQNAQNAPTTFRNPIVQNGADPWIIQKDGFYYYTHTTGNNVTVWKSATIQGIENSTRVVVWTPPASGPTCCGIWAPELHFLNNKWYIYFAADDGNNANHRMYVLESTTTDPQGSYVLKGKITPPQDNWAIDGTVLQKPDGSLYFVWSGWPGTVDGLQNLYIAPMSNPWTISGSRVLISTPTNAWETQTARINEGPEPVIRNGKIMIVFSASASWTDDYKMGLLTSTDGNVLNPASWTKAANPIFAKTATVFGPGHGSFTKSPDLTEDWVVYHAAKQQGSGWDRNIRAQKFTWSADIPNLGQPAATTIAQQIPSANIIPTAAPTAVATSPTGNPTPTLRLVTPTTHCLGACLTPSTQPAPSISIVPSEILASPTPVPSLEVPTLIIGSPSAAPAPIEGGQPPTRQQGLIFFLLQLILILFQFLFQRG